MGQQATLPGPIMMATQTIDSTNMPHTTMHKRSWRATERCSLMAGFLLLTLVCSQALATPPRTFSANYNATYEGIRAGAQRSLTFDASTGQYVLTSTVELTLFGSSLSKIVERSQFLWLDEKPLPQHYEFVQTGFGSRTRT